jgi:hypothetical protein
MIRLLETNQQPSQHVEVLPLSRKWGKVFVPQSKCSTKLIPSRTLLYAPGESGTSLPNMFYPFCMQ